MPLSKWYSSLKRISWITRLPLSLRESIAALTFGVVTFSLLTIQFSPNWWVLCEQLSYANAEVSTPVDQAQVDRAIMSAYWARGFYVTRQVADFAAPIDDPNHQIVRWRLLIPAFSRLVELPPWATLGLAHLGSFFLVLFLVSLGRREALASGDMGRRGILLGLIAGSTAPFITSMGLLGYYDSWLGVSLLASAFARRRGIVLLACVLAPWVDERFVLGLPLALWTRWLTTEDGIISFREWFRLEAVWPIILTLGYALLRLGLGGTGGSQTIGEYLNAFVLSVRIPISQRLYGAWAGLRLGWILVLAAVLGSLRSTTPGATARSAILTAIIICTAAVGVFSALDISRSMILLLPTLPLGYSFVSKASARPIRWGIHLVAACALLLPATHVIGQKRIPVDTFWSFPSPLLAVQNNLGVMYASGNGVRANPELGVKWLTQAAEAGSADAQRNLGYLHEHGIGVPKIPERAAYWYHRAAAGGNAQAHADLGRLYDIGHGVRKDAVAAMTWRKRAAELGLTSAQNELGVAYATGVGVSRDSVEAVRWYLLAAEGGDPVAQFNLGMMLAKGEGVSQDLEASARWVRLSALRGNAYAQHRLATILMEGTGVDKNVDEASTWYVRSASQGLPQAQNDLGSMYTGGKLRPPDPVAAVKWYRLAAEQGYAPAQFNLGVMYTLGSGVPKSLLEGYRWMASAAEGGITDAQQRLDEISRMLSQEELVEAKRLVQETASTRARRN